jgi:hypothetical protein
MPPLKALDCLQVPPPPAVEMLGEMEAVATWVESRTKAGRCAIERKDEVCTDEARNYGADGRTCRFC